MRDLTFCWCRKQGLHPCDGVVPCLVSSPANDAFVICAADVAKSPGDVGHSEGARRRRSDRMASTRSCCSSTWALWYGPVRFLFPDPRRSDPLVLWRRGGAPASPAGTQLPPSLRRRRRAAPRLRAVLNRGRLRHGGGALASPAGTHLPPSPSRRRPAAPLVPRERPRALLHRGRPGPRRRAGLRVSGGGGAAGPAPSRSGGLLPAAGGARCTRGRRASRPCVPRSCDGGRGAVMVRPGYRGRHCDFCGRYGSKMRMRGPEWTRVGVFLARVFNIFSRDHFYRIL